jgi:hypothetical protein
MSDWQSSSVPRCLCRRRMQNHARKMMSARPAMPPMTPPTIAPMGIDDEDAEGREEGVGDNVDDEGDIDEEGTIVAGSIHPIVSTRTRYSCILHNSTYPRPPSESAITPPPRATLRSASRTHSCYSCYTPAVHARSKISPRCQTYPTSRSHSAAVPLAPAHFRCSPARRADSTRRCIAGQDT